MSGLIQFTGQFNKQALLCMNQPQLVYAYFEVRPSTAVAHIRLPLNFSLVLDRSGSMHGEKIMQLRQAVEALVAQLQPDDYLSIVIFNNRANVLIPASPVGNLGDLRRRLEKLKADGGTNIAPALRIALEEIAKYIGPDKISRLILLTDGHTVEEEACERQATEAGRMGVPIIALGLGSDWKEDLLIGLGQRSGLLGSAGLISRAEQMQTIFQDVLAEMKVIARHLSFRVLMVQGVEARRVWQVVPLIKDVSLYAIQGQAVTVELPELSQAGVAYLVEMLVPPRQPGIYRFAQGEVLYDVPAQGLGQQKESVNLMAEVTLNPQQAQQVNGRVMTIVEKVTAFKLQTQALSDANAGNVTAATQKLRAAHTILLDQGELDLAQNALAEAQRLEKGLGFSNEGKKTVRLQSSKTVKLSDLEIGSNG